MQLHREVRPKASSQLLKRLCVYLRSLNPPYHSIFQGKSNRFLSYGHQDLLQSPDSENVNSFYKSRDFFCPPQSLIGLPLWLRWSRIHLQCGRPGFDPWVGKILQRRERLPTPVFWPGEFHGLYIQSMGAKSQTQLSNFHFLSLYPHALLDTQQPLICSPFL